MHTTIQETLKNGFYAGHESFETLKNYAENETDLRNAISAIVQALNIKDGVPRVINDSDPSRMPRNIWGMSAMPIRTLLSIQN